VSRFCSPNGWTKTSSGSESPALTRLGPATRLMARSGRWSRGKSRTPLRARISGGISRESSISPSLTMITGRSDAEAASRAGASRERPLPGIVSAPSRSSPKLRTSPHRTAESRAWRHRPPAAPKLKDASSRIRGRSGAARTGQLRFTSSRPSAAQATARQRRGTQERRPRRSSTR
jgi:hypothetical protein